MRLSKRTTVLMAMVLVILVASSTTVFVNRVSAFVARKSRYRLDVPTLLNRPSPVSLVAGGSTALKPEAQAGPTRMVFIHHSVGDGWLKDGLRAGLNNNKYYVVDVSYGWGPQDEDAGSGTIGDHTDIGDWYDWFVGPRRDTYTKSLFAADSNAGLNQNVPDPGGKNNVVLFKSCFPNSGLWGRPDDPPTAGDNPLRGQSVGSSYYSVTNAKGIYNNLLTYFANRQDKLFVVVTAPPLVRPDTDPTQAANARALNRWLVTDWLKDYPHNNVAVFDLFSVLTTNGGNPNKNDLGAETGDHHRYRNGMVEYLTGRESNYAAYGQSDWDSHPTAAGYQKATAEFIPLLNSALNCWRAKGGCPPLMGRGSSATRQ